MPTYEYRCPNDHTFEVFQKMSDEPVAECPECGEKAERLLSGGAGFLFKGEGFYITDYRSKEYKEKAKAEKGESGGKGDAAAKGGSDAPASSGSSDGGGSKAGGDGGSKKGGEGGKD